MNKIIISPSILSADFVNLQQDIKKIEKAGADWIHIDVMDGLFVPNITIGMPVVEAIKKVTQLPLDVHLMIDKPERYINNFKQAGADIITIHQEATTDCKGTISAIKKVGAKAGVSIKPNTPVNSIKNLIKDVDMVLVMSVEPGFGGQKFIPNCIDKIKEIREIAKTVNPELIIQVDGGINKETAQLVKQAGADSLVAGSYIYKSLNIEQAIQSLR